MNLNAPPKYVETAWQQILGRIGDGIDGCFKKRQDVRLVNGERFTMKSADGSEWAMGVSNAGATTWTKL